MDILIIAPPQEKREVGRDEECDVREFSCSREVTVRY